MAHLARFQPAENRLRRGGGPRAGQNGGADLHPFRQRPVPLHLDLARNASDADAFGLADCETVSDAELGAVEPAPGLETWEARLALALLQATEESPKRLIEPPQDLLLGGVGVER